MPCKKVALAKQLIARPDSCGSKQDAYWTVEMAQNPTAGARKLGLVVAPSNLSRQEAFLLTESYIHTHRPKRLGPIRAVQIPERETIPLRHPRRKLPTGTK